MKIKTLYTASVCSVLLLAGCDQPDNSNQANTAAPAQETGQQPSVAAPVIDTLKSAETKAQEVSGVISGAAENLNNATQNAAGQALTAAESAAVATGEAANASTEKAVEAVDAIKSPQ